MNFLSKNLVLLSISAVLAGFLNSTAVFSHDQEKHSGTSGAKETESMTNNKKTPEKSFFEKAKDAVPDCVKKNPEKAIQEIKEKGIQGLKGLGQGGCKLE